jgi:hypothetical protein
MVLLILGLVFVASALFDLVEELFHKADPSRDSIRSA